jgi:hypothetical protein
MLGPEDYPDVSVTIQHPFGDLDVPLTEWIRLGPGPRPLLQIVAAHRLSTGQEVPLEEIPQEYHNSPQSRRRQRQGLLPMPWGPLPDGS